jgi:hypothetical protein
VNCTSRAKAEQGIDRGKIFALGFPSYDTTIVGHFCRRTIPWTPEAGKYSLAIADGDEKILNYIYFEVSGPEADRNLLSEEKEGTFTN